MYGSSPMYVAADGENTPAVYLFPTSDTNENQEDV